MNQLSHIATNLVSELDKLRQRLTQAHPNGFTTIGGGCAEKSDINPVQAVQAMHLRKNSYDSSGSGPRLRTKAVPKRGVGFKLAIEQDSASSKTLS